MLKHQVYMIQSIDNGGVYIGYTTNLRKRWNGHCSHMRNMVNTPLYASMRSHGADRHALSVVELHPSREEALEAEAWLIAYFRALGARVFNCTKGGESPGVVSLETRARQSAAKRGKPMSLETRARIGEAQRTSEASRAHIAKLNSTKRVITPEHRAKIGAAKKGRVLSPETRAKMSASRKGKPWTQSRRAAQRIQ